MGHITLHRPHWHDHNLVLSFHYQTEWGTHEAKHIRLPKINKGRVIQAGQYGQYELDQVILFMPSPVRIPQITQDQSFKIAYLEDIYVESMAEEFTSCFGRTRRR